MITRRKITRVTHEFAVTITREEIRKLAGAPPHADIQAIAEPQGLVDVNGDMIVSWTDVTSTVQEPKDHLPDDDPRPDGTEEDGS